MSKAALDFFGEVLMRRVRDQAILDWKMILAGDMKGEDAERIRKSMETFGPGQQSTILSFVANAVDRTLHHLLWTFEQIENINVAVDFDDDHVESLRQISDGLAGELYSDNGWIARFSEEKI